MWELYEELEDLCQTSSDALKKANEKIRAAGGKLGTGDVEYLDKLTHMIKSIKTSLAMMGAEGESSYGGRSYDSNSYARGRGRYARRDSGSSRYARSYDDGMMHELKDLIDDTSDERTKQRLMRIMNEMG